MTLSLFNPQPKQPYKQYRERRRRLKKDADIEWHDIVCNRAMEDTEHGPMFRCFHCDTLFGRDYVCGDHWPETKGHQPKIRLDPDAGVCCCMGCNRSDNPLRKH